MFLLALALVLLMAGDSYSQKRSRQQPPNVPTQSPPVEQRGPEQIPPPTRTVPDEQSKEQSEKAERDRQEKAAIDKKIADETERLANQTAALSAHAERLTWFTFLLFFAALIQIGLFWWQLRMIKRTLAPAEEAAKAAQESANVSYSASIGTPEIPSR